MEIAENRMVTLTYDLHIDDKEGELIEQATAENPLKFLYGAGMMLPRFESSLTGLKAGEAFEINLMSRDAYGEVDENAVVDLPKSVFLINGEFDSELIYEGNSVPMMSSNGQRLNGLVLEVTENSVKMDFNHPLAGEDLYFKGTVLSVVQPTEEEIAQFTQGGCGCGSGSCGSDCSDDSCASDSCGCGCNC
jgi:FKBP-type peptidyl-prolyl cis-trans isomerase SlyD